MKMQMHFYPEESNVSAYGIHHVTIFCGDARQNVDFYTDVLGLRFVKKTVNFDDPEVYHFYYGDEGGRPGSIITFFPSEKAPGELGAGQAMETSYRVPAKAIDYWARRLAEKGVRADPIERRFGEAVLPFRDADGVRLALVGVHGAETEPAFAGADVPQDCALRGFHGVSLLQHDAASTATILSDVLGFIPVAFEGPVTRFQVNHTAYGGVIDIHVDRNASEGRLGPGSIHHVAFRAADDGQQAEMARKLSETHSLTVTQQLNRNYFRSIYFTEPGGVRFEIATDEPGFAVDEPASELGRNLKLPPWLEARRLTIEAVLPVID
ncbi:ring-cleaving dioxygenase [Mesorhizobium sp. 1M-11]|uniref:ring-cleaving dioxygenase n=1 Tax=Mesorhizobium sp. 1M-11 TaxID=1529006 RepID=UPI000AC0C4E5|nr:ring-cleaving dioxygenase [Mesorhizobium sp. 1M-11]